MQSVAFSPDGSRVVTGGHDLTIRLWSVEVAIGTPRLNAEVVVLHGHNNIVTDVAFGPDGTWILSCSRDGTVRMWRTTPLGQRLSG